MSETTVPHGVKDQIDAYGFAVRAYSWASAEVAAARASLEAAIAHLRASQEGLGIPQETPEWSPLMVALDAMAEVWDREKAAESGTDDLVSVAEDVMDAWLAYRQTRFGGKPVLPSGDPERTPL